MEETINEQTAIKEHIITAMLNLSIADIREEAELDKIDFETLIGEIRVS